MAHGGKEYPKDLPATWPFRAAGTVFIAAFVWFCMGFAIKDTGDELANHMAYGDYLAEHGDVRGEFIRVQLALEDESRPPAERDDLRRREAELLAAHQGEWLGPLAPVVLEDRDVGEHRRASGFVNRASWRRGWLDDVYVWWFDTAAARALMRSVLIRHIAADLAIVLDRRPDADVNGCEHGLFRNH